MDIWVDASKLWGLGIVIDDEWDAWHWRSPWHFEGRDIRWAEAVAVKLAARILFERGLANAAVLIHGNNQGVIGSFDRGRGRNFHVNLAIRRTDVIASSSNMLYILKYVKSEYNKADPISSGELGPRTNQITGYIQLPFLTMFSTAIIRQTLAQASVTSDAAPSTSTLTNRTVSSIPRTSEGRITKNRKPHKGNSYAPSLFRSHVPASERLHHWLSPHALSHHNQVTSQIPFLAASILMHGMLSSLKQKTRSNYSAGLLRFTQYCDQLHIPEHKHCPACETLLSAFIASYAGKRVYQQLVSGLAILAYLPRCSLAWLRYTHLHQERRLKTRP